MVKIANFFKNHLWVQVIVIFVFTVLLAGEIYFFRNQLSPLLKWPALAFALIIILLIIMWYKVPIFRKILGEDKTRKRSQSYWAICAFLTIIFIIPVTLYNIQLLSVKSSLPYFIVISFLFAGISFGLSVMKQIATESRKELFGIGQKFSLALIFYVIFIPLLNLLNQTPFNKIDIYSSPNLINSTALVGGIMFYSAATLFYGGEFLFMFGLTDLVRSWIDLDIFTNTDNTVKPDELIKTEVATESAVSLKQYVENKSTKGENAVQGYDFIMDIRWGDKDKWTLSEMKFENIYKGWDIIFSQESAKAIHTPFLQAPNELEQEMWEAELKQIVVKLKDTLVFLMNIRTVTVESGPSVKTMLTGPGQMKIKTPINRNLSFTISTSSTPSTGIIQDFWSDLVSHPAYKRMVDYYINALKATSENEIAVELYKILEELESHFRNEKQTCIEIGYSLTKWKNLKQNLNSEKRHIPGKFQEPANRMSIDECLREVKGIIDIFRTKDS